ncbi:MAG: EAL domain-containing protein [Spirochaetia bacterium]
MADEVNNPKVSIARDPPVRLKTPVREKSRERVSLFDEGFAHLFKEFGYVFVEGEEKEEEFFSIIDGTNDTVLLLSEDGIIEWATDAACDFFGLNTSELQGSSIYDFVMPLYHSVIEKGMSQARVHLSENHSHSIEKRIVFRGKNAFNEIYSAECFFTGLLRNGSFRLLGVFRDILKEQDILEQYKKLEEHYSALSETLNEAIIRIDEHFNIVFANYAVLPTFGYSKEELLGKKFSILFPPEIFERHRDEFKKYFWVDDQHRSKVGLKKAIEILGKHKRRGVSPMEMSFGNSSHFNGRTLTCIIRDITKRKNIERQLRKLAFHDKLTNLGNRDLFEQEMNSLIEKMATYSSFRGALLFLDLDGFKHINDTLGHKAGDALLIETAGRLRECLRESDSIYRFGGDEFVIMLPYIHADKDAAKVAEKILAIIRKPYYLESKDENKNTTMVTIGVSIGIALFPDHGDNPENLIQNADLAMYSAKEAGKNRYSFYCDSMVSRATMGLKIEQGIKKALNEGLFELHYQPIVDEAGRIKGAEGLLRWTDEELGEVSPAVFIPVAEEKGIICSLGAWVIETSCKDLAHFSHTPYDDFYISINVSPLQIEDRHFASKLRDTIHRTKVDPALLQLEITESSLMRNPEGTIETLETIKKENPGIKIAIDDFGTGYSSLSYLSHLPADSVKIDISFVSGFKRSRNSKIIDTIANLAESLELELVAEGIETEEQKKYFTNHLCEKLQGFYYSHAVPRKELIDLLEAGRIL